MNKTILIIEDVPETLALLKWRAGRHQFDCILDQTGSDWLTTDDHEKPDAVLLDMNLPTISGFGILREFKQNKKLADVPIFVLSGVDNQEVKAEAMSLGASAYFSKRENIDKIFEHIHQVVTRH